MRYVDLFAGCGGLSLGIESAGGQLVFAVEKSDMAARTFFHNLVGDASDEKEWNRYVASDLEKQIKGKVVVRPLSDLLANENCLDEAANLDLDLVVGGPPCQGFSMAGRRNKDDLRNRLAWDYLTFVERTSPKAVVIENVVGMSRSFTDGEDSSFKQLQLALSANGESKYEYVVQSVLVNALHYGAPQFRPRLMLIAIRNDIAALLGVKATTEIWKSDFVDRINVADIPDLAPIPIVRAGESFTIRDAISDLDGWAGHNRGRNAQYKDWLRNFATQIQKRPERQSGIPNQKPRKHNHRVSTRFSFYRMMLESGLDQSLLSAMSSLPTELALRLAREELRKIKLPIELLTSTLGSSIVIEDLDELVGLAFTLVTKKHSQKVLSPDGPSRTVVTLPDDYGHPVAPRTFTVRELARFQGFPDNFEFVGRETTGAHRRRVEVPQYTQVGNAVSPWQAWAVGKKIVPIIELFNSLNEVVAAIPAGRARFDETSPYDESKAAMVS